MPTSRRPRKTCVPHPSQAQTASGIALQRYALLRQDPGPGLRAAHTRERRRPCSALPDERTATTPTLISRSQGRRTRPGRPAGWLRDRPGLRGGHPGEAVLAPEPAAAMLLPGSQRRGGIHRHVRRRLSAATAVAGTTFRVGADELAEQVGGVARSRQSTRKGADDTGGQVRQLDCDYAMVQRMADRLVTRQVPPPTAI
jgi:hypothetical protein